MLSYIKKLLPKRKVVYDSDFFKESWFTNWDDLKYVLDALVFSQKWTSCLDFGCGPGIMIDHMNDKGVRYVGCDFSQEAGLLYQSCFGKYPQNYLDNLSGIDLATFDVLISFDVFEHMTDGQIVELIRTSKPIRYFFLNISRDLRIPGHINIKSDKSWISFLDKNGLAYDFDRTTQVRNKYLEIKPDAPDLWQKNMFIFSRK